VVQFYYQQIKLKKGNKMNIQHDEQEQRGVFFIEHEGNRVARMTYSLKQGNMVVEHTIVDEALRGNDIGAQLVSEGVTFAREKNMKIVPVCTYAKKLLERSKEYEDVLADY
jgi:predicted GNAT family acetyltransferase